MKRICLTIAGLWLAAALTACSSAESSFEAKTYLPDGEEIHSVDIDVQDREIRVLPSEDGMLRIDYAESEKESYSFSVSDGVLTMVSQSNKAWTDYIGAAASGGADQIILYLPDTQLSALSLHTTKEDITLSALTVTGSLSLSTNGGDISFDAVSAGDGIALENKNGDITGVIAGDYGEYAITCSIKKGESNLPDEKDGGTKTLAVTNNNGDIDIAFDAS